MYVMFTGTQGTFHGFPFDASLNIKYFTMA